MDSKQLDYLREEVRRGFLGGPNGDVAALLSAYEALTKPARPIRIITKTDDDVLSIITLHDGIMLGFIKTEKPVAEIIAAAVNSYDPARLARYEAALREIATGYDHDEDAHRYGTPCRMCLATEALAGKEKANG